MHTSIVQRNQIVRTILSIRDFMYYFEDVIFFFFFIFFNLATQHKWCCFKHEIISFFLDLNKSVVRWRWFLAKRSAERRAKWVYNLVESEARAQCVNRVLVLASCKLAALIFTCIYPMVSAMTSYSSLTSRRSFFFLGNIRLKAISNSITGWPKYSWRAVFSSSAKQCLLSVNLKPFLMKTEQQTQERRIVNPLFF